MNDESLIDALLPAVKQQIESAETPYVKVTYTRLVEQEGLSPDEAVEAIALCLADETNRMYIDKRDFDQDRYQELLCTLPESLEE
ncbi:hypothetical protein JIN77_03400 [Verrucomicrobiaceae bacterium R5-34]|nr:hypothetical protein [Verrucomicrobiaceae bacterium R5-34]